jgi:hypothetical protein
LNFRGSKIKQFSGEHESFQSGLNERDYLNIARKKIDLFKTVKKVKFFGNSN